MKTTLSIVGLMIICGVAVPTNTVAQKSDPVKWEFTAVPVSANKARLVFTASIDEGWHIYSQFIGTGGPLPTTFSFTPDTKYSLKGKVKEEGNPVTKYDSTFDMKIVWYSNSVSFSQEVNLQAAVTTINGKIEFMICTDKTCLPPKEVAFSVEVKADKRNENNKGG